MKKNIPSLFALFFILGVSSILSVYAQWTKISNIQGLNGISFSSANIGYVVGNNGTIYKTTNGGTSWTNISLTGGGTLNKVDFLNDTIGIIGGDGASYRTSDGDNTWEPIAYLDTFDILDMQYTSDSIIYGCGRIRAIVKSTDQGATWSRLVTPGTQTFRGIHMVNQDTGHAIAWDQAYFAIGAAKYWNTTDGNSWNQNVLVPAISLNSIHFPTPDIGYVAGSGGSVYKTTNAGVNWAMVADSTSNMGTDYLYTVYFINPDTGWVGGMNEKIARTTNGGVDWITQNYDFDFAGKRIEDLYFFNDQLAFAVGGNGIYKTTNGGGDTPLSIKDSPNKTFPNITVQPNPFSGQAKVNIPFEKISTKDYFVLYDLTGKKVYEINITAPSFILEQGELSTGLYIYEVFNDHSIAERGKLLIK